MLRLLLFAFSGFILAKVLLDPTPQTPMYLVLALLLALVVATTMKKRGTND